MLGTVLTQKHSSLISDTEVSGGGEKKGGFGWEGYVSVSKLWFSGTDLQTC